MAHKKQWQHINTLRLKMTIVGTELNEHFSDSTMRMSLLINVEGLVNDWLMVGLVISLGEELLYAAHVWN